MPEFDVWRQRFAFLEPDLLDGVLDNSQFQEIPKNTEILREGQYIKVIPMVIEGAIKVFTRFMEKALLLYSIRPDESCTMSFATSMKNEPGKVFTITEVDTQAILLTSRKLTPELSPFFYLPAWKVFARYRRYLV